MAVHLFLLHPSSSSSFQFKFPLSFTTLTPDIIKDSTRKTRVNVFSKVKDLEPKILCKEDEEKHVNTGNAVIYKDDIVFKDPQHSPKLSSIFGLSATLPLAAASFLLNPQDALAAGGEFGILEGRSMALIHPIVMGGLFVYTLYAGYLGWQWRRVRTLQDEINQLKKQVPVTADGNEPPPESPLQLQIQRLSEERKELIKGQYKDKHFNAGSILLGFGVFESIAGGVNTYLRTGKLFPGPHLYAGAAITVLWAAAAALVPPMQKGSETARNLHIALNVLNVLLFVTQIPTGWDIVLKVFEFTKWP
ncbi:uncharacterized protein LOC143542294 [Bidens hawaiensis]|uniref:uncharacterized protein LOC143542294 n=1 Tax=Bidens hawaiensis TaxID=980011 RepID=UPI0040492BC1